MSIIELICDDITNYILDKFLDNLTEILVNKYHINKVDFINFLYNKQQNIAIIHDNNIEKWLIKNTQFIVKSPQVPIIVGKINDEPFSKLDIKKCLHNKWKIMIIKNKSLKPNKIYEE